MLLLGLLALAHIASAIKNLVVFGDSYSDIGNVGIFTDNANWVQDLAYSWNAGLYDYAYGGATCDNSVEQYVQVPSVSEQVSNYIEHGQGKNMNSAESVYALFIGINDANIFNASNTQAVADCVSQQMRALQQAYGAHTFLILNLPPMQDSPGALAATPDLKQAKADWVVSYNQLLNQSVNSLDDSIELFLFNTWDLFNTVLANASAYGFTNTTGHWNQYPCTNSTYCPENPGGIMGANEYMWFDGTHVTSAMHKLIANNIISAQPFGIQGKPVQNQYIVNRTAQAIPESESTRISIHVFTTVLMCVLVVIASCTLA